MFGAGIDPSAAGKKSAIGRRLAKQRRLEDAVYERSSNGMALYKRAQDEARRNRALEEARLQADREVTRLNEEADSIRRGIEHLRLESQDIARDCNARLAERDELTQQVDALRSRLESDDGLVQWLRTVGEERVTAAADLLGWIEPETESDDVAS